MNNPIGICFPDFIGSRPLDCLFAQGLGKENTGAERDDFLSPTKPLKGAALQQIMRQSKTFAA